MHEVPSFAIVAAIMPSACSRWAYQHQHRERRVSTVLSRAHLLDLLVWLKRLLAGNLAQCLVPLKYCPNHNLHCH